MSTSSVSDLQGVSKKIIYLYMYVYIKTNFLFDAKSKFWHSNLNIKYANVKNTLEKVISDIGRKASEWK